LFDFKFTTATSGGGALKFKDIVVVEKLDYSIDIQPYFNS